jgi:hypothetical protein
MELQMSKSFTGFSLVFLAAAVAACAGDAPTTPTVSASRLADAAPNLSVGQAQTEGALVAALRRSTARFHRIEVALAEGYTQGSACEATAAGGMGMHFPNRSLFDAVIDPERPEVLMYEPRKNGELRLVGVEFLIPAAAWDATHSGPPTYAGQAFEDRRAPGSGGPPFPNYGLHLWVWQNNPSGLFAPWNPTVSCEFAA